LYSQNLKHFTERQIAQYPLSRPNLINSKTVFISTLIIVPTLSLIIYLTGVGRHRTLYLNSLISTTILSIVFLIFITVGLYNGWKLSDRYGNFLDKLKLWKKPESSGLDLSHFDFNHVEAESCIGTIGSILLWITIAVFGALIFWAIGAIVWATILLTAGLLYWIIFRAYRLIFRNSKRCKGYLLKSVGTALLYTLLYNCWIYAIIILTHYLQE